ncbi:hypothetical protein CORC01_01853 [Colletotrichum orchidophilum]|uniref:Uncharacterized protein n=1 Tax=Colletotrichum orchidophilum TaxID=1209926 RepID=A0A1G4BMR1_9PEZI|nr:uncharacterized protein CORC01_01853 [Colletotrichum orchidophilum]OHF02752.1 hypothetical protein CORC01_01853 [Colletotrichum orchidophilum]
MARDPQRLVFDRTARNRTIGDISLLRSYCCVFIGAQVSTDAARLDSKRPSGANPTREALAGLPFGFPLARICLPFVVCGLSSAAACFCSPTFPSTATGYKQQPSINKARNCRNEQGHGGCDGAPPISSPEEPTAARGVAARYPYGAQILELPPHSAKERKGEGETGESRLGQGFPAWDTFRSSVAAHVFDVPDPTPLVAPYRTGAFSHQESTVPSIPIMPIPQAADRTHHWLLSRRCTSHVPRPVFPRPLSSQDPHSHASPHSNSTRLTPSSLAHPQPTCLTPPDPGVVHSIPSEEP